MNSIKLSKNIPKRALSKPRRQCGKPECSHLTTKSRCHKHRCERDKSRGSAAEHGVPFHHKGSHRRISFDSNINQEWDIP